MQNDTYKICLTGHRPPKLDGYNLNTPYYERLQAYLFKTLEDGLCKYNTLECSSGLALGADTIWSKAILQAKEKYGDRIVFHCHIPNRKQFCKWIKQHDIDFWYHQINMADRVTCIDETGTMSPGKALNIRNHSMVNCSDLILAIHDGTSGGTGNCVDYANSKNKQVFTIPPHIFK